MSSTDKSVSFDMLDSAGECSPCLCSGIGCMRSKIVVVVECEVKHDSRAIRASVFFEMRFLMISLL